MSAFPLTRNIETLQERARHIRQLIISMLAIAESGHSAGALGLTDVYTALYYGLLQHDPANSQWNERDRVIISNGHTCPVLYATLASCGYFSENELQTLRDIDSRLQGHPHLGSLPGVENSSGPLAQGLSQASGLAYSLRMDGLTNNVVALLSDGEQEEGQTWEAYLFAAKYQLNNLTAIIDRNNIQIDGFTEEVMPLEPLRDKLLSFNWHVQVIDAHNFEQILRAVDAATAEQTKPSVIVAQTTPGKGVSFMENKYEWHGKPPNTEQAQQALEELHRDTNG